MTSVRVRPPMFSGPSQLHRARLPSVAASIANVRSGERGAFSIEHHRVGAHRLQRIVRLCVEQHEEERTPYDSPDLADGYARLKRLGGRTDLNSPYEGRGGEDVTEQASIAGSRTRRSA